ncbi:thioredoxin peroxidase dot5 [Recurvomyces mirabilis]|nr:thioredoxin peroxidase dot5 [Recurvomyces mirabilis]
MVELRKRPAPPAPAATLPKSKKGTTSKTKAAPAKGKKDDAQKETKPPPSNPSDDPTGGIPEGAGGVSATAEVTSAEVAKEVAAKAEAEAVKGKGKGKNAAAAPKAKSGPPEVGESVELEGFGGEVETNDGEKTTLAKLVEESKAGVVLFTYPKASTPGCTTQVCLFRDSYTPLTGTGLSIYGLSTDTPKANTTFKTKQNLPYPLLCDPSATLIQAIGFKKAPKGTTRGVFVIDKSGKVLAAEAGGPAPTVEVVKGIVESMGGDTNAKGLEKAEERAVGAEGEKVEGESVAAVAAEVADSAAKVDASAKL